jgi:quercetin dioxygenase-like cupin family protein
MGPVSVVMRIKTCPGRRSVDAVLLSDRQTPTINDGGDMKMNTAPVLALALLGAAAFAQVAGVRRTDLLRHDIRIPGREIVQVRVEVDPGRAVPRHTHPGDEVLYVLEGTLEYLPDGKAPVTLKAGQSVFIPAGTVHAARNPGTVNGTGIATYVVEKGKPLITPAK